MSSVQCQKQYDCFYKERFFWKKKKSTYYHRGRNGFCYPHELAWLPWFQCTGVQSDRSHYTSNRCFASEGPECCAPFQNMAAHTIEAIKGQTRQHKSTIMKDYLTHTLNFTAFPWWSTTLTWNAINCILNLPQATWFLKINLKVNCL